MIIEFNSGYGQVPEKLINDTRKQVMSFVHTDRKINRVEITLKEDKVFIPPENKVCCIKLVLVSNSLVVHARSENFKSAIGEAMKELKKRLKQQKYTSMVA